MLEYDPEKRPSFSEIEKRLDTKKLKIGKAKKFVKKIVDNPEID